MTPASGPRRIEGAEAGVVLVAVIWLLALLGGVTVAMSLFTVNTLASIDAIGGRPRAEAALRAGLNEAATEVLAGVPRALGATRVGDARVTWRAVDETARIDVNLAPAELLAGLFVRLGASADAAAGYAGLIVALRGPPAAAQPAPAARPPGYDPDDETPAGIAGAARGGLPDAGAQDRRKPIVDVIQLQQIPGLPPALMARAAPFLTTFSGIAQVNVRLAAPEVIEALPGMTRERIRTVLELRGREGNPAGLSDALGEAVRFTTDKPGAAARVRVGAVLSDGFATAADIVIVHYADDRSPYRVLLWDDAVAASDRSKEPDP